MRKLLLAFLILMASMTSTAWASLTASVPPALSKQEVVQEKAITIASTGTWSEEPTSYTYQWERCVFEAECTTLSGATSSTYTPVEGDVGYGIRVRVTAHKGEATGSASSGITIGVEPKYTSLYPAGNWWNTKTESAAADAQSANYSLWFEEAFCWNGTTKKCNEGKVPLLNFRYSTIGVSFVPTGAPTMSGITTAFPKELTEELESGVGTAPIPSMIKQGSAGVDQHWAFEQANHKEWVYEGFTPETTYPPTSASAVGATEVHLTGASAKGFIPGASFIFTEVSTGVTTPKASPSSGETVSTTYYIKSSSESGFTFATTPEGAAVAVAGATLATTGTRIGSVKDKYNIAAYLGNTSLYKGGWYGEGGEGQEEPSPNIGQMWRWGSTTGGQVGIGGVITFADMRKVREGGKIEHVLDMALPARQERLLGPSTPGSCPAGECWSGNNKTDGTENNCGNGTSKCSGPNLPCYELAEASRCYRPPEGLHWRLRSSTNCAGMSSGPESHGFAKSICFALKEYGAIITDWASVNGVFFAQDQEVFQHSSAFTFKPWENEGPKWLEGKPNSNANLFHEIPWSGNIEVEKATLYCAPPIVITKSVEGKTAAKKEGESGCERPAP
jgi:hypothetical protein